MIALGVLVVMVVILVAAMATGRRPGSGTVSVSARAAAGGSRGEGTAAPSPPTSPAPQDLAGRLVAWEAAGLIDAGQRERIEEFEAREGGGAAAVQPPEQRIPLVAEALGYLGGALVVAALALVIGRRWESMNAAAHVGLLAAVTAAVFAAGWVVRRSDEPAVGRLGSLLWFLSSIGVGGTLGVVVADYVEPDGRVATVRCVLVVFIAVTAWSVQLWRIRRWPLQLLATFVGTTGVVMSSVGLRGSAGPPLYGSALWGLGVVWVVLAWRGMAEPALVGYALGCVSVLYAPTFIAAESTGGAVLLGLATAAALTLAAVVARRPVLLLAGAVGLFAYVPATALHYFGDTLGTDVTLFIVGVLLLGVAALVARLRSEVAEPTRS